MRFPEDNLVARKVLLYWIVKREILMELRPHEGMSITQEYEATLVRCWALGEKIPGA